MLLSWSTLEPAGTSKLAAIRFSSAVRVQHIRVFPTGAKPFAQELGIVARTDPNAFLLDVFFNAHPLSSDAKGKQKSLNALVPTTLAYTGGQLDFAVNMGADFATRLMIIKGAFERISLAIYGDIVTEPPAPASSYELAALPSTEYSDLSRALDPSRFFDPSLPARQLLALIPDSPPLQLVVRLMFCLKPPNDSWENPEFPYIYADLEPENDELSLDNACRWTLTPANDESTVEYLEKFAERVAACIGPKDATQSSLVAEILRNVASQHPDLARLLMKHLDLVSIFGDSRLDEDTVSYLLTAAANVDIARGLNAEWFLSILCDIVDNPGDDRDMQADARDLIARINGWHVLEDALSNTQANFHEATALMKTLTLSEHPFGIWVESMITHPGLVMQLSENPVLPKSHASPPQLLEQPVKTIGHDEFISFVRAYVGVSCVLAVYAWADSLPNEACRERSLGVLRLWQHVDGYREIVNHLLLLRQMTFRLECMTADNDPPTQSGILAEHIIVNLANEPRSFLRQDFVKCILSLGRPLLFINEEERKSLCDMALIASDGLPAAIHRLTSSVERPLEGKTLRSLRVSLALVAHELEHENDGEWQTLQTLWREQAHGLLVHLVELFSDVSRDLKAHFGLASAPAAPQELVRQLFSLAHETLQLIVQLIPGYHLTTRSVRALAVAVVDVFICTDAADMSYSPRTVVCVAAQGARQACISLVQALADPHADPDAKASRVLLRTLLQHGTRNDNSDPVSNQLQVFCLVDRVLPDSVTNAGHAYWVTSVITSVVSELTSFFRNLDTENKVHLVKRLVRLDQGAVGIGEWLLLEELRSLSQVLQSLSEGMLEDHHQLLAKYQVSLSLRFMVDFLTSPSELTPWFFTALETVPEISQLLTGCLVSSAEEHTLLPHLGQLAESLAQRAEVLDAELRYITALLLFQGAKAGARLDELLRLALTIVTDLSADTTDFAGLDRELGATLVTASEMTLTSETGEAILTTLQWCSNERNRRLPMPSSAWEKLSHNLQQVLGSTTTDDILNSTGKIIAVGEQPAVAPPRLPDAIALSLDELCDLLRPPIPIPSTPKQQAQDEVFNMVTVSPPTAFLRSPAVTGLTKTYSNNDFRQLRSLPSARQNTSRLPSTHVDEFEFSDSSPSLAAVPSPEVYHLALLSPTFNTQQ